jgi:His-Xaa-Ser system protein HxsD
MAASDSKSNDIAIFLNRAVYDKEAVMASSYALADMFSAYMEIQGENYLLTLKLLKTYHENDLEILKDRFLNELIDQQLRIDLEKRFGPIRELIVKQAFAPLENLEAEVKKLVGRG